MKKNYFLFIILLALFSFLPENLYSQGATCQEAEPFCAAGGSLLFPNVTGVPSTGSLDCLGSIPNPAWFYLQVAESGLLVFEILQNSEFDVNGNPIGTGIDVDFAVWGPFADIEGNCDAVLDGSLPSVDCSFSAAPIETMTIPGALVGEIYIVVITNYTPTMPGTAGFIRLTQTNFGDPGAGSTNCDIVTVCSIEIDGGDQTYCDVPEVTLTTTTTGPVETYAWYKDGVLLPGEITGTLVITETGDYRVVADGTDCDAAVEDEVTITMLFGAECNGLPPCATLDFEEDFGTGTGRVSTPFSTYIFNEFTQLEGGEYAITNISTGLNSGWHVGMEDHTIDDVDGRMMFVNASDDPTITEFYRRTIPLQADTDYTFAFWMTTVYDIDTAICVGTGDPSNVTYRIEDPTGTLIAEISTGDIPNESDPNWQQYSLIFNTATNTDIQLVMLNNTFGVCGNDFAIDDLTIISEGTPPVLVTPNDLTLCDEFGNQTATFDLTSQIPAILNGLNPAEFNVTFHLSQEDADTNASPVATPIAYVNTTNPETIYVRVERVNDSECFSTVNFDLIIDEVVELTVALPVSVEICSTDSFPELDATPTNTGIDLTLVTYEWTNEAGVIVSTSAVFTPTEAGIYTVVITYPPCSENTFSVEIIVTEAPELDLGADEVICNGDSFEIVPTITGGTTDITYLWSTGETTETIVVDQSGTYTLEITVGACTVTDSITVTIAEALEVTIGDDFQTCPDELQTVTATTSEEGVTFQWFLNDNLISGETESSIEISLEPGTMGSQTLRVEISKDGCTASDEVDITLYDVGNCTISQGISPNGDSMNDELDLTFLNDRTGIAKLQIFNRFGTLVYEKTNYVNEWIGQSKDGNELPTGTYFYVIDFNGNDPVYKNQATGWVYLNREAN